MMNHNHKPKTDRKTKLVRIFSLVVVIAMIGTLLLTIAPVHAYASEEKAAADSKGISPIVLFLITVILGLTVYSAYRLRKEQPRDLSSDLMQKDPWREPDHPEFESEKDENTR